MHISDKTIADLGWGALLAQLAQRAHTPRGALLCRGLSPLADLDAARARLEEVAEARALQDTGEALPLEGVREIGDALERSSKGGALEAQELRDVGSTLTAGALVRRLLLTRSARAPRLLGRATVLSDLDDVSGPIADSFEDGGRLSDRASPALGGLRRRALAVRDELERKMAHILDASHVEPFLQDRFYTQRDDRYVVPVRVDARARVRGIVHGTSQSGQTVFVEPEDVVDLNNRLKLAELEVAEEERRILAELSRLVEEARPRIAANLEVLAVLDLISASAKLAVDLKATPPELSEGGGVDLRRARHPLMVLKQHACVPNDIRIGNGQTLVISGPNAGGKTVALKTVGLLSLMARCGLHVPAQEGSQLPLVVEVLSDVGDDQSLERDLSTFSAHVMHLREFLEAARTGALVLLDEVAVGTDPDQGAALAQAVLEGLAERGATTVVTTHYDRLKGLAARDHRFVNAAVGFDVDKLAPTYELHLGVPGASGAIVIARRLGLDPALCARATELAGDVHTGVEALLFEVEAERRRMREARTAVDEERAVAARERAEAERRALEAKEKLARMRRGAHDEAVETLRQARDELDRTRTVLRRSGGKVTDATVKEARQKIDAAASLVHEAGPRPEPPPGRAATAAELRAGVQVWVTRLGARAQVTAPPKGGKVAVQAGPLKVSVGIDEVRLLDHAAPAPPTARSRRGHNAFDAPVVLADPSASVRGGVSTLDLRGERVDVAVGMAEKFLDDALRSGQQAVLVIHGHGTGALRDALREQLSGFPGVSAMRPGTPNEGGDGVTVISLD